MDFEEKITIGVIVLFLAFITIVFGIKLVGIHIQTSAGQHTGYITAVEKNGILFKTYKVYLKTDTQSSQEDSYCVMDSTLIPALKKEQEDKTRVTVDFIDYFSAGITNCGLYTGGIITGVK